MQKGQRWSTLFLENESRFSRTIASAPSILASRAIRIPAGPAPIMRTRSPFAALPRAYSWWPNRFSIRDHVDVHFQLVNLAFNSWKTAKPRTVEASPIDSRRAVNEFNMSRKSSDCIKETKFCSASVILVEMVRLERLKKRSPNKI